MDIASRLKKFIDSTGIQYSQFADSCGIPRPSLSQLLTGRNKKVSNEVIEKIHRSYPSLSIAWLMFGEGEMGFVENIEFSDAQNHKNIDNYPTLFSQKECVTSNLDSIVSDSPLVSEKISADKPQPENKFPIHQAMEFVSRTSSEPRKVTSIMIFYSDNSFETFVPQQ